jgi:YebC/PmpR family DNA-binding regulatory protein
MGRAFEFRKERKFKRWGNMARTFTRLGKEITIAAKAGGTDPDSNPRLRSLILNAKSENMPKDNIDRAIKRAVEKDHADYKEVVYEGYGPHGIAILIETATDNTTRTVANVRSYFNKFGGSLGTSGSVDFMFERKCVFKVTSENPIDIEELELELIDFGADEVFKEVDEEDESKEYIVIYGAFESFGSIQKYLEEKGFQIISGRFERIPTTELKKLTPEEKADVDTLLEKIEADDDVQNVYHLMDISEN